MDDPNIFLGIELGSTRIKAVIIDENFRPVSSGEFTWESRLENGLWTYPLDEVWSGLRSALRNLTGNGPVAVTGVSAMMHGFLAFDRDWKLLTPFRTWQNTVTGPAAEVLTQRFHFNIPQRWSIAHLYQAILNEEPYVSEIAHITTLAGYVHHSLTGENVLGIGDASGMFPIDSETGDYQEEMLRSFDELIAGRGFPWKLRELLPRVLKAGEYAGRVTEDGAVLLDRLLPVGLPMVPPEGDAGTGMTATNAVAPRTGNVSAGTSIFSMVVLEHPLRQVHEEIDMVTTPDGSPVAMVHCNNCTGDFNAWIHLLREAAELFGATPSENQLYTALYQKSLEGDLDCGGIQICNYLAGEGVTHFNAGAPLVTRKAGTTLTLANFIRSNLYSSLATLQIGMDLLAEEGVIIDSITGHGGLFKTPGVAQRYLAAACGAPVSCMETAAEGGPYGMALLASFTALRNPGESLESYLKRMVFRDTKVITLKASPDEERGFRNYLDQYRALLKVEARALADL